MTIDVFIRTTSQSDRLRQAMLRVSIERWALETPHWYLVKDMGITQGRVFAERHAESDPYAFTDDDCLIVGEKWLDRAASMVLANPKFAIVSTLSLIEGENLAVPHDDSDIYEMHSVGQPMLIRKGICVNLPDMDLNQECGILHKFVLDKGYQMGLIHPKHHIRHNHMGSGFSSNPALFWGY